MSLKNLPHPRPNFNKKKKQIPLFPKFLVRNRSVLRTKTTPLPQTTSHIMIRSTISGNHYMLIQAHAIAPTRTFIFNLSAYRYTSAQGLLALLFITQPLPLPPFIPINELLFPNPLQSFKLRNAIPPNHNLTNILISVIDALIDRFFQHYTTFKNGSKPRRVPTTLRFPLSVRRSFLSMNLLRSGPFVCVGAIV